MAAARVGDIPEVRPHGKAIAKRLMDVAVAGGTLVALSPLLLAVALAIRLKLGSPVFFKQLRPGLHGRLFTIYKFRTMLDTRGADGSFLPDAERLTRFGRFLRVTSIDEFPELLNVLRGDMSLVGPRPLLAKYLPYYSSSERRRHDVRPGITGWAQIKGRNTVTWNERLAYDIWYVENQSALLDFRILLLTLLSVLRREGVVADPRSLMGDLDTERNGESHGR